jgi:hypothetical protein
MRRILLPCVIMMALSFSAFSSTTSAGVSSRAALQTLLPAARLINVTLSDALDYISSISGANFNIDWKSLEAANISKQTLINLNLHSIRLDKLLTMVLNEAAGGDTLTWYVDGNIIEITTREVSDKKLITVVYYVDDILLANAPFNGLITGGSTSFSNTGSGGGGGTSSTALNNSSSNNATNTVNTTQLSDGLLKLIETIEHPEVWRDNGGTTVMAYYNGNLIVSAPRSIQEAIGGPVN